MTSDVVAVTVKEGGRQAIEIILKPGAAPPIAAAAPAATPAAAPSGDTGAPTSSPGTSPAAGPESTTASSLSTSTSSGSGLRIAGFVGIGIGLVGFGIAGAFASKASSKHTDADNLYKQYNCDHPGPSNCSLGGAQRAQIQGYDDEANNAKKTATLGVVIGAVGVAGGAALLILGMGGSKEKSSAASSSVTPWVGLGSAGLSGTF
jgi:hypothetical protein